MARHYIQDVNQLQAAKKGDTIVLFGNAVYARFEAGVKKAGSASDIAAKTGWIEQPERYVNQSLLTLLKKESDILRVFVNSEILKELKQSKISRIHLAHDGLVKFAKKTTKAGNFIYFVVHKVEAEKIYLIEKWFFVDGELQEIKEQNVKIDYHTEIESQLAYEIKRVTDEYKTPPKIVLTGFHGLGEETIANVVHRQHPEVTDAAGHLLRQKNKVLRSVNNFYVLNYEKLPVSQQPLSLHNEKRSKEIVAPLGVALAGVAFFYAVDWYGHSQYQNAVSEHQSAIAKIQDIYSKGRAPIQLVQQRQYYLEEINADEPYVGNNIERVLRAVSVARRSLPSFDPLFVKIDYDTHGEIPLQTSNDTFDFILEVSFKHAGDDGLLEKAKLLQTEITRALGVTTRSTSIPRKSGDEGRHIVTMAGEFSE